MATVALGQLLTAWGGDKIHLWQFDSKFIKKYKRENNFTRGIQQLITLRK